jgi:hypothetical protein
LNQNIIRGYVIVLPLPVVVVTVVTLVVETVVAVVVVGSLMTLPRSSLALRSKSAVSSAWSLEVSEFPPSLELSGSEFSLRAPLVPAVGVLLCSGSRSKDRIFIYLLLFFFFFTYVNVNCAFFWSRSIVKIKPEINYNVTVPYYEQYLLFALLVGVVAQILLIVRPIAALLVRANLI